jgi:hypothetical protein
LIRGHAPFFVRRQHPPVLVDHLASWLPRAQCLDSLQARLGVPAPQAHPPELLEGEQKVRHVVDPAPYQHEPELQRLPGGVLRAPVEWWLDHEGARYVAQIVERGQAGWMGSFEDPAVGTEGGNRARL